MSLRNIKLHTWRRITQVGIGLILTNSYLPVIWTRTLYTGPLRSICVPHLNCHSCPSAIMGCPIGMLQHYIGIHQVPYLILGFLGLVGITFGRAACGWLCPFGWIQDMMYKIKTVKFKLPRFLFNFKYVFLAVFVVLLPYLTDVHWFSKICPWGGLGAGIPWVLWNPVNPFTEMPTILPGEVGEWFTIKMIILGIFLILFVFTARPFCNIMCPLGAIYSFFNKYSLLKIDVDSKCNECDLCKKDCAVDLVAYESANDTDCIKCLECAETCGKVKVKFNFDNLKPPFITSPNNSKKK